MLHAIDKSLGPPFHRNSGVLTEILHAQCLPNGILNMTTRHFEDEKKMSRYMSTFTYFLNTFTNATG